MMVTGSPSAGENATQVKSRERDTNVTRNITSALFC